MHVNLAAQVLSKTMAVTLRKLSRSDSEATATFCEMINSFFDCLNVRSLDGSDLKRNPNLTPYTSVNDPRFNWLIEEFLGYFDKWKENITCRKGNYSNADRSKMFVSRQTYKGLKITVNSVVEVIKFLLDEGMDYVLTNRFQQDILEQLFGNYRKFGRRNENPDLQQISYQRGY